mgnify:CR=1 FL=1
MNKGILIHGSFRSDNFGDYLLYKISKDVVLHTRNKDAVIFDGVSKMYLNLEDSIVLSPFKAVNSSSHIVCAGGGYFGEPNNVGLKWNLQCLKNHILPLLYATFSNKRIALLGVGVGPISNFFLRIMIKRIVNKAEVVSVRDIESKQFLKSIGIKKDIVVHADWVMSNAFITSFPLDNPKNDGDTVFVHITSRSTDKLDMIGADLKKIATTNERIKIIIGSDNNYSNPNSLNPARYLYEHLNSVNCTLCNYKNPIDLLNIINDCDLIVTSKLHVGICGIRLRKKVVALPIHQKIIRFYRQIHYTEYLRIFDELQAGELYNMIINRFNNNELVDIDSICSDADENITLLTNFLSK